MRGFFDCFSDGIVDFDFSLVVSWFLIVLVISIS